MIKLQRVIAAIGSVLIFSSAGTGQAQAAEVAISGATDWISTDQWEGVLRDDFRADPVQTDNSYRLNGLYRVDITDYQAPIDRFTIYLNGTLVGTTGPKNEEAPAVNNVITAWEDSSFSKGTFTIGSGLLTIFTVDGSAYWGQYGIRFNNYFSNSNALRLDSAGTTTEKSSVVSCTPGKYTFLNAGASAETAKVQSYVYTLLVNGKAVSTLSTDSFKSVASHQFPIIVGNMTGTATLDGATWDLKGMSNYSAQCQVHAFQSGANTQSMTTAAHDAVALAAAATEAAKAQMTKDMLANWNSSNEAAAKKQRDNRLAGKP